MPTVVRCLRCDREPADPYAPCPDCLTAGVSANHRVIDAIGAGTARTPLRALSSHPNTYFKDERGGMTWSYKDRLAEAAAAHAAGVRADTMVVSSSGNHGASVAAAAAALGMRCVVLTTASASPAMLRLIAGCGGDLVPLRTPEERWAVMREAVSTRGWYPASNFHDPPIGSNPYAVAGYRAVAEEIHAQIGAPDWVVVPVGYADGLAGIADGFLRLARDHGIRVPRLLAAVTSPSLPDALASGHDQPRHAPVVAGLALSIACPQATYQGVHALRATDGSAVLVDDQMALEARRQLGRSEGLFVEVSSAVAHAAAVEAWRTGLIEDDELVVIVGTSSGLKDQPLPDESDQAPQPVDGDLGAVLAFLGLP